MKEETGVPFEDDVVRLYKEGFTYAEISDHVGVTYDSLRGVIKKLVNAAVIERRFAAFERLGFVVTLEMEDEVAKRYAAGATYAEIAASCGMSEGRLRHVLERLARVGVIQRRVPQRKRNFIDEPTWKLDRSAARCLRRQRACKGVRRAWEREPDWTREHTDKARDMTL